MYLKKNIPLYIAMVILVSILFCSCDKWLPQERENIGVIDSEIPQKVYRPILGRNSEISNIFSKGSTSFPASFKILNIRKRSGDDAPELRTVLPVKVWINAYTGLEKSLEEIEAKRAIQNRPVFEIGERSGSLIFWSTANSNFIRTMPDSGYYFDIEVSNSGGRRYFQQLSLQPMKEVPYEPSNFDPLTGMQTSPYVYPNAGVFMKADTSIAGEGELSMSSSDIQITINKRSGPATNKLTFRFLDKNNNFINPDKFGDTEWSSLVHGFNMVKTATGVTYDVAYPIPLAQTNTRFTSGAGRFARAMFRYSRIGYGNRTEQNYFGLDFAIHEPGDWEILFRFHRVNPKFN